MSTFFIVSGQTAKLTTQARRGLGGRAKSKRRKERSAGGYGASGKRAGETENEQHTASKKSAHSIK